MFKRNAKVFQLMFSKFEYDGKLNPTFVEGPFELPLSSVRAYIKDPITQVNILFSSFYQILSIIMSRPSSSFWGRERVSRVRVLYNYLFVASLVYNYLFVASLVDSYM